MNTNQVGKITELEILTYITKLGYSVSLPYGDKDRYDQIWDINGKLLRIQIKTSRWKNDDHKAIIFNTRSTYRNQQHRYSKEEIDYFATIWEEQVYIVPVEQCSIEKTLWFERPKNGCQVAFAKNFIVEEVLK